MKTKKAILANKLHIWNLERHILGIGTKSTKSIVSSNSKIQTCELPAGRNTRACLQWFFAGKSRLASQWFWRGKKRYPLLSQFWAELFRDDVHYVLVEGKAWKSKINMCLRHKKVSSIFIPSTKSSCHCTVNGLGATTIQPYSCRAWLQPHKLQTLHRTKI